MRVLLPLVNSPWEELNFNEKILQRHLEANPDMTFEEADELLEILP